MDKAEFFHHLQGRIWFVGLQIINIFLALGPLRSGERRAWWLMLISGIVIFGGLFLPFLKYKNEMGKIDKIVFGILAMIYLLSLSITWR